MGVGGEGGGGPKFVYPEFTHIQCYGLISKKRHMTAPPPLLTYTYAPLFLCAPTWPPPYAPVHHFNRQFSPSRAPPDLGGV